MSWQQARLADISSMRTGKLDSNAAIPEGAYPFFTCAQETLRIDEPAFDTEAVLLGGNNAAGIFPLKYYNGQFNAYQRTYVIESLAPDVLNIRYLYYALRPALAHFQSASIGAATQYLTKGILDNFQVPLPPVTIQNRIVIILSAYDELIENNRRRIQLLEEAARLLYREWFVHLRFPGHEHVAVVDGVPEGWERKILVELLTLQRGFDLPLSQRKEGAFPIYASTGINGFHSDPKVAGPGVVTGRSGSLGTVMYVPGDFWPLNTTLWVKEFKRVGPHYAMHLLENLHMEQYNGGVAVPTLNRNDVHRIEALCPPSLLLRLFEEQVDTLERQKTILQKTNDRAAAARDLLLPRLMNGEISA